MSQTTAVVGLDVHANQTHAAVLDPATGEVQVHRLDGPPTQVAEFLATLGEETRAAYEAGPTGLTLARAAAERGLDVRVCAPGSLRRPQERVKTDRRDAIRLARLYLAGELSFCHIPSREEECFRDLVRAREDLRGDLMRARHRLSKFLLRRELRFPGQEGNWTQPHLAWLDRLRFDDPAAAATFADYLAAVKALLQRRSYLEGELEQLWPESPFAETVARLRCFRGLGTLSACGMSAEVGDVSRFRKPAQLASYLGIVPSESTSDERRRQGAITKTGPTHARRLLVEASYHYRHRPRVSLELARRQRGQDPRVVEVAWRAQRRLNQRWRILGERRGKPTGVVAVACARELTSFLWEAATLN